MSRVLIVSPSGSFYGSEQVLFDYLNNTKLNFEVAVPWKTVLANKIKSAFTRHSLRYFSNKYLPFFYLNIFLSLLVNKYHAVYINEAGHVKYILLLAKIFTKKNFLVHVRIIEDTHASRWINAQRNNIVVLSVSDYIRTALPLSSQLLYDPFYFEKDNALKEVPGKIELLRVGIIGRVTKTKGLDRLQDLLTVLHNIYPKKKIVFNLFGTISEDAYVDNWLDNLVSSGYIVPKGFFDDQDDMYNSIDCVLHLSSQEALGRIFFEAVNKGKPFIGLDAAGIGEIGKLLGLKEFLVPVGDNTCFEIAEKLKMVSDHYADCCQRVFAAREKAASVFDIQAYVETMDKLLAG